MVFINSTMCCVRVEVAIILDSPEQDSLNSIVITLYELFFTMNLN